MPNHMSNLPATVRAFFRPIHRVPRDPPRQTGSGYPFCCVTADILHTYRFS